MKAQFEKTNPTAGSFRSSNFPPFGDALRGRISQSQNHQLTRKMAQVRERHGRALVRKAMQSTAAISASETESTRRCTGPRTREGKQKSSQNSTKHGCCSKQVLLPEEDPEEWEALKADWLQSYETPDPVSLKLVLQAAAMQWQQIRAQNAFSVAQYAIYEEQPDCTRWTDEHHKLYAKFQRYLSAAERSFLRAFHEIERLRRDQRKQEEVAFKQDLDRQRFALRQDKHQHEIALIQTKADFCTAKTAAANRATVPKAEKASPPA